MFLIPGGEGVGTEPLATLCAARSVWLGGTAPCRFNVG